MLWFSIDHLVVWWIRGGWLGLLLERLTFFRNGHISVRVHSRLTRFDRISCSWRYCSHLFSWRLVVACCSESNIFLKINFKEYTNRIIYQPTPNPQFGNSFFCKMKHGRNALGYKEKLKGAQRVYFSCSTYWESK